VLESFSVLVLFSLGCCIIKLTFSVIELGIVFTDTLIDAIPILVVHPNIASYGDLPISII